jgi:transposase-like protein
MMKKGTRYIQAEKKKAYDYAMHLYADHPDLSCRALQALLENQGYTVDHTTVYRWMRKA